MATEKKFKVFGTFEGQKVLENVMAFSTKQAKLRGAFAAGFGGNDVTRFINSRSIKVKRR